MIKAFGGGQIHINNSGAGTVKIDGKIKTSKDNKDNAIDLRMNNAASFWNMTAASNLTSLTMNNGAVVDCGRIKMVTANWKYKSLSVQTVFLNRI